jgi:hypothetical protein
MRGVRTGDVIDRRYRLDDQLGSGANGVVWSAHDTKLKRMVALKRPNSVVHKAERAEFRREAENAAKVHHPSVISVFDTVDTDECWLVMEYLPSRNLDQILATNGPLSPDRVARIGLQVAAALQAAHAKDIVHRDVKPGNVLVAGGDLAKLTDFGISVWREATVTRDGKISGTAAYVAPEVADAQPATKASDVFSLGATLFAAVEGSPPFGTGDPDAILARARRGRIPDMHRAGPLAPVLSEMLALRAAKRPTADQVWQRLKETVGEWEPPQSQHAPEIPPWRRPLSWVITGVVVAIVVAVGWTVLAPGSGQGPDAQEHGAPAGSSPTQPADIIDDERTADPCALTDQNALHQFGTTELLPEYGNFNRCDIQVDVGGEQPVDIEFELATADVPRVVRPGAFDVERPPLSNDECDRRVFATDEYDVWITAKDNPTPDLCAMADVATNSAVERLRRGPLPPRKPFAPASLANLDACALLDKNALARLPGIDATHPKIGFGNWDCRWSSTIDGTDLFLLFDQDQPLTADDGTPARLAGHDAFVEAGGYGDKSCAVRVVHRPFSDSHGQSEVEVLIVVVRGDGAGAKFCPMATDFAKAAAVKLPTQ